MITRFKTLPTVVHHLQKRINATFGHCIVDFTIIALGIDAFKFQFKTFFLISILLLQFT